MRIFFLTQWYPSPKSPINGVFIREHARAISLYHQVYVVYVKGIAQAGSYNSDILMTDDGSLAEKTISYHKPGIPKTAWILRIRKVFKFFDELSDSGNRPDIIHANVYNTADLAAFLSRKYHIPAVLTEHASTYPRQLFSKFQAQKVRFFINQLDMIMPVSQDLCQHMRDYGIRGPFLAVPNTIDVNIFHPGGVKPNREDGTFRILVVARLIELKGIDFLINALAKLMDQGRNFQLMIVGDGPERMKLASLADQLNLSEVTTFYGFMDTHDVARMMQEADIFALTSLWENQPAVLLEAMACGLPVLASRVGGIPEIMTSDCGLLAEPGNVQSICENLELLMDNISAYPSEIISEYARMKFSPQAVGKAFSQAYQQVVEEYQSAG